MNRAQRRKSQKDQKKELKPDTICRSIPIIRAARQQADFSGVPLATMCQSIQLLINELAGRGYPIYDFDNKTKSIQGIQIIQNRVYFLAAEEDDNHEKV